MYLYLHAEVCVRYSLLPEIRANVEYTKTSGWCGDDTDRHIVTRQLLVSHIACTVAKPCTSPSQTLLYGCISSAVAECDRIEKCNKNVVQMSITMNL